MVICYSSSSKLIHLVLGGQVIYSGLRNTMKTLAYYLLLLSLWLFPVSYIVSAHFGYNTCVKDYCHLYNKDNPKPATVPQPTKHKEICTSVVLLFSVFHVYYYKIAIIIFLLLF